MIWTPLVSINDQVSSYNQTVTTADNSSVMHNFTITVDARVDGKKMPIADAMVCIYSVNSADQQRYYQHDDHRPAEGRSEQYGRERCRQL